MKSITENLRLGVMELFAVLMPGAALCIILGQWPALKEIFLQNKRLFHLDKNKNWKLVGWMNEKMPK